MTYFEWDPAKADSNFRKHGVRFEVATEVFADRFALAEMDQMVDGEQRWKTTGLAGEMLLVVVSLIAIIEEDEYVRIISARKGERKELRNMKSRNSTEIPLPKNAPPGFAVRRYLGQPLSEEARQNLRDLANMKDEEIDYSDIPPLTDEFWKNAVRNPFYRPVKKQLTVRVDSDVIAWLKQKGAGYQTRINALLREAMLAERASSK